jgi:hypothetical protein
MIGYSAKGGDLGIQPGLFDEPRWVLLMKISIFQNNTHTTKMVSDIAHVKV